MIEFRRARPYDWPDIEPCLDGLTAQGRVSIKNISECVVAEESGDFIGVAIVERFQQVGLLSVIHVALEWQGHGTARALLQRCIRDAASAGVSWVFAQGAQIERLLLSSGFEVERAELIPAFLLPRLLCKDDSLGTPMSWAANDPLHEPQ